MEVPFVKRGAKAVARLNQKCSTAENDNLDSIKILNKGERKYA